MEKRLKVTPKIFQCSSFPIRDSWTDKRTYSKLLHAFNFGLHHLNYFSIMPLLKGQRQLPHLSQVHCVVVGGELGDDVPSSGTT